MTIHVELQRLQSALAGSPDDDPNWAAVALADIIRKYPPTKPVIVTEWAVIMERSGNVWNKYPSREAAQAFRDEIPDVGMYVATRQVVDGGRSDWKRA